MTDQSEWVGRVGHSWAEEWRRTDRSFGALTDRLLERARAGVFTHAVDIGCGAGEIALRLATDNPQGRILGLDVSAQLLGAARSRGQHLANLDFALADASAWGADGGAQPDLYVSRHGVMFFERPVAAFSHLRRQALAQARLVFSCFRTRHENIWARELAGVAATGGADTGDPRAPGPFAFGEKPYVEAILAEAGWQDIAFEPVDYAMIAGEGANALDDATSYFLRIGPAARAIAALDGDARDAAMARLRAMLAAHEADGVIALPAACWIVSARA